MSLPEATLSLVDCLYGSDGNGVGAWGGGGDGDDDVFAI